MAVTQEFSVEGFPELFAAMDEMKEEIGKGKTDRIWREALKKAFEPVLRSAQSRAPQDTGQLSKRIYMKVHRPNSSDRRSKYYEQGEIYMARVSASPLRDDSELRVVLNKRGRFQNVWGNKRPVAVSQEFGNANNKAQPFLRPALESNVSNVLAILKGSLESAIEEVARKAARAKAGG
jgi:HK97 gp10 family phage protein